MITFRELEFLSSLARRKHFARAAKDCGVSQPAFSMQIRKIEERLGTAIVKRGNRFQGFTPEGDILIRNARKILSDMKTMEQEFRSARGEVSGRLSIGVIPTAVIHASRMVKRLKNRHPGILVTIHTATSLAIQQGMEYGQFEAGFTYGEGVPGDLYRVDTVYMERYQLFAPRSLVPDGQETITWAEAAQMPLSLLEPDMQNRRILDRVFGEQGLVPRVVSESTGFTSAMVMAAEGLSATIVPDHLAETFSGLGGVVALPLTAPDLEKEVCLVSPMRDPSIPTVDALHKACATQ